MSESSGPRPDFQNTKRQTVLELSLVFGLSLGASAVYSIVSLISKLTAEKGLAAQTTTINRTLSEREWLDLTYQILGLTFGLVPVALALYLIWLERRNPFEALGLRGAAAGRALGNIWRGLALTALIGLPGIGLYIGARLLGLSTRIVPADLGEYWWTIPILLFAAAKASVLEEVLVVGYLFDRLRLMALRPWVIIWVSALLRASYHLYQGFGGFIGNLVMGIIFGWYYQKTGRLWPLLVAHFLLDAFSFVGYSLLSGVLPLP